jgi:hypothetical protein
MKLSEAANRVIDLSSKVREYYDAEYRKRYPNYPLVGPDWESVPPPPEEKELQQVLSTLPEELIYQLHLIMYLGRMSFGTGDLARKYEEIRADFSDAEQARADILGQAAALAYDLEDGLEELRSHDIDVDHLPLRSAKVSKP